jgi:hypothetical protein
VIEVAVVNFVFGTFTAAGDCVIFMRRSPQHESLQKGVRKRVKPETHAVCIRTGPPTAGAAVAAAVGAGAAAGAETGSAFFTFAGFV